MDQQLLRTTALHEIYSKTCVSVGTGEHQHYTSLLALICWSKTNWSRLLRTIREETVDCRACAGPALNALDVHPASAAYSYRCPFGPPGPARARARPGPVNSGPCLARPYNLAGRVGSAHGPTTEVGPPEAHWRWRGRGLGERPAVEAVG